MTEKRKPQCNSKKNSCKTNKKNCSKKSCSTKAAPKKENVVTKKQDSFGARILNILKLFKSND